MIVLDTAHELARNPKTNSPQVKQSIVLLSSKLAGKQDSPSTFPSALQGSAATPRMLEHKTPSRAPRYTPRTVSSVRSHDYHPAIIYSNGYDYSQDQLLPKRLGMVELLASLKDGLATQMEPTKKGREAVIQPRKQLRGRQEKNPWARGASLERNEKKIGRSSCCGT